MKCVTLETKNSIVLIPELGLALSPGESLTLSEKAYANIAKQYVGQLVVVAQLEKDTLRGGTYERQAKKNGKASIEAAEALSPSMPQEGEVVPAVADKSMQAKNTRIRRK